VAVEIAGQKKCAKTDSVKVAAQVKIVLVPFPEEYVRAAQSVILDRSKQAALAATKRR